MSATADAYLNTRISAMATGLRDAEALAGLAKLPLPALAERLKLDALLDDTLSVQTKRRAVEQALLNLLLADLAVLLRPLDAAGCGLLLTWARRYSLINLKTLIRGKLHGLERTEIRENLFELPRRVRLPQQELYRAENVLELLRLLENGPLRLIARQARESYEQRREPFVLEAAVDQRYYAELARQGLRFHGSDSQAVQRLLGAMLDRMNLLWLLRFRVSFRFSASETFYHLVPSSRVMHRERLLKLANIDGFEQVLAALPEPLRTRMAGADSLIEVQRRLGGQLIDECRVTLASGRSGIARALAYLLLREHDLDQLLALIQGRLLGLPQEVVDVALELTAPKCPIGMAEAA